MQDDRGGTSPSLPPDMWSAEDAIAYIYERAYYGKKNGLHNMRALLARLGDPQRGLRCVHVAGTNGKGSTCALIESALRAAGYRTGLYTSPMLERYHERIRVEGREIDDETLARSAWRVREAAEAMEVAGEGVATFFEVGTAVMFLAFRAAGVDIAVIEVGVGGRLDPTNVIEAPLVSAIASIGFDHTKMLGDTLEAIAAEKAGICKPGCPVAIAAQPVQARAVLIEAARTLGCPVWDAGSARIEGIAAGLWGQRFRIEVPDGPEDRTSRAERHMCELQIGLIGDYQRENAALALYALLALASRGALVPIDAIARGFAAARWPGRMDWHERANVLVDGAHNRPGARALAASLASLFPGQRHPFVIGAMADKDVDGILEALAPAMSRAYCTQVEGERAMPAQELARRIAAYGVPAEAHATPASAYEALRAREPDALGIVAGSLYLAGALLPVLRRA